MASDLFSSANTMAANPINNILDIARNAGLIDVAMEGYNAYRNGKLDVFVNYHYYNNDKFRKF